TTHPNRFCVPDQISIQRYGPSKAHRDRQAFCSNRQRGGKLVSNRKVDLQALGYRNNPRLY
ncbi:unnamed protein product, partial [Fusarium graminearum]